MEKLASFGLLPGDQTQNLRSSILGSQETKKWVGPTVGAEDVGEDRPEVLVVRQFVNHFGQAARRHLEEEGQVLGQAGADQELGQGDGTQLQHSKEPNTSTGFLKTKARVTHDVKDTVNSFNIPNTLPKAKPGIFQNFIAQTINQIVKKFGDHNCHLHTPEAKYQLNQRDYNNSNMDVTETPTWKLGCVARPLTSAYENEIGLSLSLSGYLCYS